MDTTHQPGGFMDAPPTNVPISQPVMADPPQQPPQQQPPQYSAPSKDVVPASSIPIPVTVSGPSDEHIIDLVIAIPTMRRWTKNREIAPERYLFPLVDGLLGSLTPTQQNHTRVLLFNVDHEPEQHLEVFDVMNKFPGLIYLMNKTHQMDAGKKRSGEPEEDKIVLEKPNGEVVEVSQGTMAWITGETHDATHLMYEARKLAPYVLFLEDDVKPTSNVVKKMSDYVCQMKEKNIDSWFMVDLYTPRINWGRNPLYVENFERYDFECCTQAMLFRSDKLLDLLLYESTHSQFPIDDNIRDYAREESSRGIYAMTPNLFEHVGRFSSNPEKSSERVEHTSINFVP
jgi:hypothetical protein